MKCGFLNVNSINADERSIALCELITSESIDIMGIVETKLAYNTSVKNNTSCPDGYKMYHRARKNSTLGGGVGLILSKKFKNVKMFDDNALVSFEHLRLSFSYEKTTFDVSVIYRPPGNSFPFTHFLDELSSHLEIISTSSCHKLVLGDFNVHVDVENDYKAKRFLTMLSDSDFKNIISCPTHRGGRTLDLVLVPGTQNSGDFEVHPELTFSDHYVILGCLPITTTSAKFEKNIHFSTLQKSEY